MRLDLTDIPYHIFARGNEKKAIFFDPQDRWVYLKLLQKAREKFQFSLYSYALMDNHFHLLLEMREGASLSRLMHRLQLLYTRYINAKYQRVGHLFQGRFHSNLIERDRYFLAVDRYIHLNPVRAGLVQTPEAYLWSSYSFRLGLRHSDWLDHSVLEYFGNDEKLRLTKYSQFTQAGIGKPEEWSHADLRKTPTIGSVEYFKQVKQTNTEYFKQVKQTNTLRVLTCSNGRT